MKKPTLSLRIISLIAIIFTLWSCERDVKTEPKVTPGAFDNGVFISNEGPFQSGTGTISFFNRANGIIYNDLFETANNYPLGNIVQSMSIYNGKGYIVVNNANKIEIVDMATFKASGKIEGLTLPRFFLGINAGKAYVTSWNNSVSVVNLSTKEITASIPAGTGPERMIQIGNYVFVANQGGFSIDSTITVIDAITDIPVTTIQVFPKPSGMVKDKNGKLWVLCSGSGFNGWPQPGDSEAHLLRIDPTSFSIEKDIPFADNTNHPDKLAINETGDVLYYIYKEGVYDFQINSNAVKSSALIQHSGYFYSIDYDAKAKCLFLSDPLDFVQKGWVYRFNPVNGQVIDSLKAGVIPTYFTFN
jgi:YVTN family beta-propeller protein